MRIVHIIFSFTTGGTETMLVDIVNEQANHVNVTLIIINTDINQALLQGLDKRILIVKLNREPKSKSLMPFIKLNYILFKLKPDFIHLHNHNAINGLLPFFRKRGFLTIHAMGIPSTNFSKYKKIFAISQAVKKDVWMRSEFNTEVIYNGIRPEFIFERSCLKSKNKSVFRIVQVGRLDHENKGQHLAIKAIKRLIENEFQEIYLDFIGDGESLGYLKELTKLNHLESRVKFLGLKDRKFIYDNLKNYDLLIQPSLCEGFGLTIAEALIARIPVLVSDIEGPMEVIKSGKFGFYFKNNNEFDLAIKIDMVMKFEINELLEIIEAAYQHAKEHYNVKNTALNYLNKYSIN